jgi:hypothetical protein
VKDDAYEGVALAEIIDQKFKWQYVSVFSTTNSYGSDLSTQFQKNALSQNRFNPNFREFQLFHLEIVFRIMYASGRGDVNLMLKCNT